MRPAAVARLVAAVALTAAAGIVLPAAPASAAACSSAHGVTVVVDFHELGGGAEAGLRRRRWRRQCRPSCSAATASRSTYVQRQPGFVCRVSGSRAEDPCVNTPPTDAYWGLWWSDGESGDWVYSSESAGGLNVPDGGYVAFSWNGSADRSPSGRQPVPARARAHGRPRPGATRRWERPAAVAAAVAAAAAAAPAVARVAARRRRRRATRRPPRPRPRPGRRTSRTSPARLTRPTRSTSPAPRATTRPTRTRRHRRTQPNRELRVDRGRDDRGPPSDAGDDGLPAWVAPVGIGALFAAAGVVALVRRRATS